MPGLAQRKYLLCEVILVRSFVPNDLLIVLVRQGGHMAGDGRLLPNRGRRDRLFLPLNGIDEVLEVIDSAVALVEVCSAVEMHRLAGRYVGGRLAPEALW